MNIAFFLKPKHEVAFLYEDQSLRQGLEKAAPRLCRHPGHHSRKQIYRYGKRGGLPPLSSHEEGRRLSSTTMRELEDVTICQALLPHAAKNPAVRITQTAEELLFQAMNQNFIPVVDDFDSFIGIVTRKDILSYFYREMMRHPQEMPGLQSQAF